MFSGPEFRNVTQVALRKLKELFPMSDLRSVPSPPCRRGQCLLVAKHALKDSIAEFGGSSVRECGESGGLDGAVGFKGVDCRRDSQIVCKRRGYLLSQVRLIGLPSETTDSKELES